MGLLDSIEGMAQNAMGAGSQNTNAQVAGGLAAELQQHPGGLGSILDSFRNNGLGAHADAVQNGQAPQMSPGDVQTGLQNTSIIDNVASRVGVSPEVAKVAMATVLPMILSHMSQNGGQAPQGNVLTSMISNYL